MSPRPPASPPEPQDYNGLKAAWDESVRWTAVAAKLRQPSALPVVLRCWWHEPDRHRDKDNVRAAVKFILDGLVKAGVLRNDGNHTIAGFADDSFLYRGDAGYRGPGVLVELGPADPRQEGEVLSWAVEQELWIPHRLPDLNEMLAAREVGARKSAFRRGRGTGGDSFTQLARARGLIP